MQTSGFGLGIGAGGGSGRDRNWVLRHGKPATSFGARLEKGDHILALGSRLEMYPSRNGLPQRLLLATAPSRPALKKPANKKSSSSTRHHSTARVAYASGTPHGGVAPDSLPRYSPSGYGTHDGGSQAPQNASSSSTSSGTQSFPNHPQQYSPHWVNQRRAGEAPAVRATEPRSSPLSAVVPTILHLGPVALVAPFSAPHPTQFVPNPIFHQVSASSARNFPLEAQAVLPDVLSPGTVVEFHTDGSDHRLGLITRYADDSGDVLWVSEPVLHGSSGFTGSLSFSWLSFRAFLLLSYLQGLSSAFVCLAAASAPRLVSSKDVTFVWPRKHRNVVFEYTLENLPALIRHANNLIQQNLTQIPVVWGSYVDSQRSTIHTVSLAEFLFGQQPKPHELYVAHRLLQDSKVYFAQADRYSYACRSLAEVQQEKKNLQQRQREDRDIAQFVERLQHRLTEVSVGVHAVAPAPSIDWNPVRDAAYIDQLKSYALATPESPPADATWKSMLKPLSVGRRPDQVFNMLVQLGIMHRYENPHLARFPRRLDFDLNALKQYAQMSALLDQSMPAAIPTPSIPSPISLPRFPASVDRDAGHRRDLRSAGPAFAIDNATGSDEIDDAIGLEQRSDGSTWVHVHIGDPSRLVAPNDELDKLAQQRAQSVFLPERAVTMFPPSLSRNQFSLLPGKLNFALSYSFQLTPQGDVVEYEINPSVIDQVHCLTYEHADDLLSGDPSTMSVTKRQHAEALRKMVAISETHRERRLARGACVLDLPRAELTVINRGEEIDLKVVRDSTSVSRSMVGEFMIVVGELTAKFASTNNIPIPMRSQAARRGLRDSAPATTQVCSSDDWSTALTQLDQMSRLCAAQTETEGRPHAGLAVDIYCQATSPIRRYLDLLVQHQIKAAIRGDKLPFDRKAVQKLIGQMEHVSSELSRLTSNSHRYWMLRYLERLPLTTSYNALVTGTDFSTDPPGSNLLLFDLGWRTSAQLDRVPPRGELLKLYISFVDAFNDVVRFREVLPVSTD